MLLNCEIFVKVSEKLVAKLKFFGLLIEGIVRISRTAPIPLTERVKQKSRRLNMKNRLKGDFQSQQARQPRITNFEN